MKKKGKKVSGMGMSEDWVDDLLAPTLTGAGMIAADELKLAIGDSLDDTLGDAKDWVLNGGGFVLAAGAPMLMEKGPEKQYVKSFAAGFGGQCLYALWKKKVRNADDGTVPGIGAGEEDWSNNAYALMGRNSVMRARVGDGSNNAYAMAGKRKKEKVGAGQPAWRPGMGAHLPGFRINVGGM